LHGSAWDNSKRELVYMAFAANWNLPGMERESNRGSCFALLCFAHFAVRI
jgi:hypothetical protein